MMTILMGTYYGLFLPEIINNYINYDTLIKLDVESFLLRLFYLNTIINPIIYVVDKSGF